MTRWKAASIHLLANAAIACPVAIFLTWRWQLSGLFQTGAFRPLLTLAAAGVFLGPLLTLAVYRYGKKHLNFDLIVIATIQAVAFAGMLYAAWQSRPIYLVAVIDRFELVLANELDSADLRTAPAAFRALPGMDTKIIAAVLPRDPEKQQALIFQTLETGRDLRVMPRYYVSYQSVSREFLARAVPASEFSTHLAPEASKVFSAATRDMAISNLRVIPVSSQRGDATMLLDAHSGMPFKAVAVDPWPALAARQARLVAGHH